ncbi:MAG TPA: hypothetical protein VGT82_12275, partial [Ktedonobacteraceae bacterium]|nr:hypothetical protein [Ktedonobacteraceae bacterium]
MKRWFKDLQVMRKLLLGFGLLSPLVLGMIVIDISLSFQQAAIAKRIASASSMHSVASEVVAISTISQQLLLWNFLLGGLAIVLGCGCSILMSRVITRPLRQAQEVAHLASDVWLMELA